MGKSIPSTSRIQGLASRIGSSSSNKQAKSASRNRVAANPEAPKKPVPTGPQIFSSPPKKKMDESKGSELGGLNRMPLSNVVSDCVKRWFQDALREAKAGDTSMQVLVGQMYNSGYGVTKDPQKGRAWINRASKGRTSVWKVFDKQPGYNASDSDSEETKCDAQ